MRLNGEQDNFNSTKVRLKPDEHALNATIVANFNSTKVRLKLIAECFNLFSRLFQFH